LQDNRSLYRIVRNAPKRIFSSILKDQLDRVRQILAALFDRAALSVSAWDFRQ